MSAEKPISKSSFFAEITEREIRTLEGKLIKQFSQQLQLARKATLHILPILKVNTKNRYKLQYLHQGSQMNRQVQKCRYNSKVIMAF